MTETEAPLNGWGNHDSHNPAHAHGSEDETNGQRGGMQVLQQDNGEETVAPHQEIEATCQQGHCKSQDEMGRKLIITGVICPFLRGGVAHVIVKILPIKSLT